MSEYKHEAISRLQRWLEQNRFTVIRQQGEGPFGFLQIWSRPPLELRIVQDRGDWILHAGIDGMARQLSAEEWRSIATNTAIPAEDSGTASHVDFLTSSWLEVAASWQSDLARLDRAAASNSRIAMAKYFHRRP